MVIDYDPTPLIPVTKKLETKIFFQAVNPIEIYCVLWALYLAHSRCLARARPNASEEKIKF